MNQQNQEQNEKNFSKEKKHNYFYKVMNLINGKYYYGIHSTNDLEDGYMGNGRLIKDAIKKYGRENFIKEIIVDYPTRKEASDHEKLVVTQELVDLDECYNLQTGGLNEFVFHPTEETRLKMRLSSRHLKPPTFGKTFEEYYGKEEAAKIKEKKSKSASKRRHTDETKKKMSEWQFGKVISEITKDKIRETKKQRKDQYNITRNRLERNGGIWQTEETKQKIRDNYCRKRECIIEGIFFETMKSACIYFNISVSTLKNRIKSNHINWKTWNYAQIDS